VPHQTPNDPLVLALAALAATLGCARRAQRFIDLTGIGTDELRARAAEPALLSALLRFLEGHEPDLVSVSAELGVKPEALVEARRELEEGSR
jgi:formaldehyde-activating enzyme involved in methanogenesis